MCKVFLRLLILMKKDGKYKETGYSRTLASSLFRRTSPKGCHFCWLFLSQIVTFYNPLSIRNYDKMLDEVLI